MVDILVDNWQVFAGLTLVGAVLGGLLSTMLKGGGGSGALAEPVLSEVRSLSAVLGRFKDDLAATRDAFAGIVSLLSPDQEDPLSFSPSVRLMDPADGASHEEITLPTIDQDHDQDREGNMTEGEDLPDDPETSLAEKLVAAVLAIPALPKLPNIDRDFEILADTDLMGPILRQLQSFDTDGVNTMIGEFKTLVETTIAPAVDRARTEGIDFVLEPETIETLVKGGNEFIKTIDGFSGGIDGVIDRLQQLLND